MKFKVFKLDELYPDLQTYDLRAHLRIFSIVDTSVKFDVFMRALASHGYIRDAEVYYLNPGSEPLTGLVKITGQEEVNQMVIAHSLVGTKICHLYLVSRYADLFDDVRIGSY